MANYTYTENSNTQVCPAGKLGVPYFYTEYAISTTRTQAVSHISRYSGYTLPSAGLAVSVEMNTSSGTVAGTITISGTPTAVGTYRVCLEFHSQPTGASSGPSQYVTYYVTIAEAPPVITTETLPDPTKGAAYSETVEAEGTPPITWSVIGGELPPGLRLNASTGVISGTPT